MKAKPYILMSFLLAATASLSGVGEVKPAGASTLQLPAPPGLPAPPPLPPLPRLPNPPDPPRLDGARVHVHSYSHRHRRHHPRRHYRHHRHHRRHHG